MPELAEVEYYRKQWSKGLRKRILSVHLNAGKRIFRGADVAAILKTLRGSTLLASETHGKQMLFRFSKGGWLGVHLGMSGELRLEPAAAPALKHDHLILRQSRHSLVFSDPRQLGFIRFHSGKPTPIGGATGLPKSSRHNSTARWWNDSFRVMARHRSRLSC